MSDNEKKNYSEEELDEREPIGEEDLEYKSADDEDSIYELSDEDSIYELFDEESEDEPSDEEQADEPTDEDEPKRADLEERKREKRVKTLQFANIAALMAIFAGITLFMTFGQRPNVSYTENRDLEKPPEFNWKDYWAGEVTEQFGKYYNDTVPMRSTWKLFISNFRAHLGIKYKGGVTIVGPPPVINDTSGSGGTSRPANSVPDVVIPGGNNSDRVPDVVIPGGSDYDKVPDVVIPGQNTDTATTSKVPAVVIPGQNTNDTATSKVPAVVIPNAGG